MKFKTILLIMLITLTLGVNAYGQRSKKSTPPKHRSGNSAEHISLQHRKILEYWLASKPGWRPAVKNDAYAGQTKEVREFLDGEFQSNTNHPFYVVADFNNDEKQDFAVMLIKKVGKKNKFAVAIFNSTDNKQKLVPAFYTERVSNGDFLFWMTGDQFGNRIVVGPPGSDSGYIIKPHGRTYVIE